MARRRTREDWETLVYAYPGIGNGTRVLLLYLLKFMRSDGTVSVPRTQLAKALAVNPRRVTERIQEARQHGLLGVVVAAQPKVTAVYKMQFASSRMVRTPAPSGMSDAAREAVTRVRESPSRGADTAPLRGAPVRTSESPSRGADVGPPISKHPTTETVAVARPSTVTEKQAGDDEGDGSVEDPSAIGGPARQRRGETVRDAVAGETSLPPALRKRCLDHIQAIANVKSKTPRDTEAIDAIDALLAVLEIDLAFAFPGQADELAHLIWDMDWTPPRKAVDRYQAGVWLNMLLAAWREFAGGLTPARQPPAVEGYSIADPREVA